MKIKAILIICSCAFYPFGWCDKIIVSLIWSQPCISTSVRCVSLLFISQTKANEEWLILASTSTQKENYISDAIRILLLVCEGLSFAVFLNGQQRARYRAGEGRKQALLLEKRWSVTVRQGDSLHDVSEFTGRKRDSSFLLETRISVESLERLESSCVFEEVDCETEYQSWCSTKVCLRPQHQVYEVKKMWLPGLILLKGN